MKRLAFVYILERGHSQMPFQSLKSIPNYSLKIDKICDIDDSKDLGVSPQFIREKYVNETGYYNGGMLWVKNKKIPQKWIEYTKTSRYHDQASIEELVKEFSYFEFGENYNLQSWRFELGLEPRNVIESHINIKNNKLFYKEQPLKFIHTHFNDIRFKSFNSFMVNKMIEARQAQVNARIAEMHLWRMSDRELNDLGIGRADIKRIVREGKV